MSIGDLFWLFFIFSAIQPMLRQRMLEAMRVRKIAQLESERKSRVILLVHRQETMRLLGFPVARYIDINDSEDVLRAIQMTDDDVPLDLVLHTPGGLVLAALQIAKAVREHKAKVTVFVPHYAMSGGTLIALAADEIVMCKHSVLGPIDPQLGQSPAASLIKVIEEKPVGRIDDQTLVLADVGRKAIAQVKQAASELLERRLPAEQARALAEKLTAGARLSDMGLNREVAWPAGQHRHAERSSRTDEALSAARSHAERRRRGISAGTTTEGGRQGGLS
jgi:ClpP class serine protease